MKIETLRERIEKKEAQIEKKQNTITKKMAQIEKKSAKVRSLGYDPEEGANNARENNEAFWLIIDISTLEEDIERGYKEIEECKETLKKYQAQLAGELEKEETFIKEVPQQMKDLEQMLIREWDESDKRRREHYRKMYKELGWNEFIKQYKYSAFEYMSIADEAIHRENEREARFFILDLLNRVKDITGEVTDWSGIYLENGNTFPVLNGIVIGKEGRAKVESILAGGYNIQRLHIRTLVHSF